MSDNKDSVSAENAPTAGIVATGGISEPEQVEKGAGDDYPVIDHPHHTAPTVKTYVPRKATTEYRRRTPEETIERFLKDQEDEQQEIWNEVLSTCEQHVINDIRLLEKLSKLYTIIRKS